MPLPSPTLLWSCTIAGFCRTPGVPVRDTDGDRLLEREDVLEPGEIIRNRVEEPLLDRAGVAEHVAHAVGEELLDDLEASGALVAAGPAGNIRGHHPNRLRSASSTSTSFCPVK